MENIAIIPGDNANAASMPSPSIASHDEESGKSGSDQKSADDNAAPVPYRDYSRERKEESPKGRRSGKTAQTFPMILHEILSHPEFEDIISWLPHGRAWRIVRHKAFEERVIPLFFRHGRYSSFARQVNGWGFRRITHGTDYNAYYHEMFLCGLPHICNKMRRLTSKDEDRVKNEDAPTPDFYSLSRTNPLPSDSKTPAKQTLAAAPVLPSSVGPVLGIAAPPFSRGTKALADMSLADLEKERTEILRQMQMRVGAAAPGSGVPAAQLGRQDSAQASGNVHPGAYVQAPGASTPYTIPSGAGAPGPGPVWNVPPSSMAPAPAETGGISQAALYQALISQLTSAPGNQAAPAPLPPPPPPLPAAPSNQSILEALLGGNGGGLMQLLNAGGGGGSGGTDANNPNPALRNLHMQLAAGGGGSGGTDANNPNPALRNLQMQLGAGGGGSGGTDANNANPALRNLQMQLGAGGSGGNDANNANPALRNLQMQLQQATGAPQGVNDNGAIPGIQRQPQPPTSQLQGRSVDPASNMQLQQGAAAQQHGGNDNAPASDLTRQYQQAMSSHQRSRSAAGGGGGGGSDGDIMASIQRQIQQAQTSHQRSSSCVNGGSKDDIMASIQRQIQQAQANQQRGGGEDDFTATIQRQIQQAQANQQRGGGEDDFAATIQMQIQQAQANQQRGGGEDDFAATIQRQIQQAQANQQQQQHQLRQQDDSTEVSGMPQQAAAPGPPSQQSGNGRDAMANLQTQLQHSDPATRLQLQMLAGRLPTNNSSSSNGTSGTPDIAAIAAIMGLPGFPKASESGNN
jgi:hypothetical protein